METNDVFLSLKKQQMKVASNYCVDNPRVSFCHSHEQEQPLIHVNVAAQFDQFFSSAAVQTNWGVAPTHHLGL